MPSQGSCQVNGVVVQCALGGLAVDGVATIAVSGMPLQAGMAQATNTVSSEKPDLVSANDQVVLTTRVARCSPGINCP
jgi:hypothetical protein